MQVHFITAVEFQDAGTEVLINGIPAGEVRGVGHGPVTLPIDQYLVSGSDRLTVIVNPNPRASRAREPWTAVDGNSARPSPNGRVSVSVHRFGVGQHPAFDDTPALVTAKWDGAVGPRPVVLEETFTVMDAVPSWTWTRARPLDPKEPQVRAKITAYLARLHQLWQLERFDEFMSECEIKLSEAADAFGWDREELRSSFLTQLQANSVLPFVLQPFDAGDIDLRSVAEGRMVQCFRGDRQAVLEYRQTDSKNAFSTPLMVGMVDGRLRVLL